MRTLDCFDLICVDKGETEKLFLELDAICKSYELSGKISFYKDFPETTEFMFALKSIVEGK
jgi:hypothetical protein